jgi:hypothetical protein
MHWPRRIAIALLAVTGPAWLASCSGGGSVPVHGIVIKTVGRDCSLLSAAFPGVDHRVVSFVDEVGSVIGRGVTRTERAVGAGEGRCRLEAAYTVDLPVRHAYAAKVSSAVADIAVTPSVDYDSLAARGWRFDIRIPATA